MKTALALLSAVLFLGVAWQATADAAASTLNEGVCDGLNGPNITPGLYGLCVAYCEAVACPEPSVDPVASRQCRVASPTVLKRYRALKSATDPDMPCVKPDCPCWTAAELGQVGQTLDPHDVWLLSSDSPDFKMYKLVEQTPTAGGTPSDWVSAGIMTWDIPGVYQATQCQYENTPSGIVRGQEITAGQAAVCRAQIDTQIVDLIDSGVPVGCPPGWGCP